MGSGRPSKCYRDPQLQYTGKKYIKRLPSVPEGLKKMEFGNKKGSFNASIKFIALTSRQISANAINAVRISLNRNLQTLGEDKYSLKMISYPHHSVRMHGLVGVAKAERIAKGMKQAFGNPTYRMAKVRKGQAFLEIHINDDPIAYGVVKKALIGIKSKLPYNWKIETQGISPSNLCAQVILPKAKKETKGGLAEAKKELPASPQVGK